MGKGHVHLPSFILQACRKKKKQLQVSRKALIYNAPAVEKGGNFTLLLFILPQSVV